MYVYRYRIVVIAVFWAKSCFLTLCIFRIISLPRLFLLATNLPSFLCDVHKACCPHECDKRTNVSKGFILMHIRLGARKCNTSMISTVFLLLTALLLLTFGQLETQNKTHSWQYTLKKETHENELLVVTLLSYKNERGAYEVVYRHCTMFGNRIEPMRKNLNTGVKCSPRLSFAYGCVKTLSF